MAVEKKILSKWKYVVSKHDRGGDMSKMWYVRWKQPNGKFPKKYGKLAHINDFEERQKALEELQKYWDFQLNGDLSKSVFDKIFEFLSKSRKKKKWRKKTYSSYVSSMKRIADHLGDREISKENFRLVLEHCRAIYHPVTFNRKLADFRTFLHSVGEGHLCPDDVERVPRAQSEPARYLQDDELKVLKNLISQKDPELWLGVRFMFNCAIRPGELSKLKKKHLFLDEQQILIPANIAKTGRVRWAPIPDDFIIDIQFMRAWPPNRFLFTSPKDDTLPVTANHFSYRLRKYMDVLGFDSDYRPCYSFRNTSAKKGIESGMTEKEMMQVWGHHSLDQFIYYMRKMGAIDRENYKRKFRGI